MNRFAIISGSHRSPSQTSKVARFVRCMIERELEGVECDLLDLGETPLPLWDPDVRRFAGPWERLWRPVSERLTESTGVILVTPEWAGMVPAALKNVFLLCERNELSHKPGLIVALSSSQGGAYPVAELRMSSYKNTQFCYIPENIIVRDVRNVLNDYDHPNNIAAEEISLRRRMKYALTLLVEYADALKAVRNSGVIDLASYPFGM
jgi:NAD(P)H-dependent FMN reductase